MMDGFTAYVCKIMVPRPIGMVYGIWCAWVGWTPIGVLVRICR